MASAIREDLDYKQRCKIAEESSGRLTYSEMEYIFSLMLILFPNCINGIRGPR
jgi:hypothetical protein